jgi:sarcosine oxidase, subunit gamma
MQALSITDVSNLARYGVKGSNAAKWLADRGVKIPNVPNTWVENDQTLVLRLGGSEFLIEDQTGGKVCENLVADKVCVAGVYKVPRADAAYLLTGSKVLNLLSEVCMLDLREPALRENDLVMSQVAGISATLLRQTVNGEMVYKLWCDGTYKVYMRNILDEITEELTS